MACALTTAFAWDCRTESGGIKAIYLVEYSASDTITKSSGEISVCTLASARVFFKWELQKETAALSAPIQVNLENGTVVYEASLTAKLLGLSTAKRNELKLMAKTRLRCIVQDNEGVFWMLGAETGCDMTAAELVIGAGFGDHKGANMTIKHREWDSINLVKAAVVTTLGLT